MEEKHSGVGIISFAISLLVGLFMFVVFAIAGVLGSQHPQGTRPGPAQVIVGLMIFLLLGIDLVAVVLGIIALCQPQRKKLYGTLGLVISGMTILGTIGLILLGLMVVHSRVHSFEN